MSEQILWHVVPTTLGFALDQQWLDTARLLASSIPLSLPSLSWKHFLHIVYAWVFNAECQEYDKCLNKGAEEMSYVYTY